MFAALAGKPRWDSVARDTWSPAIWASSLSKIKASCTTSQTRLFNRIVGAEGSVVKPDAIGLAQSKAHLGERIDRVETGDSIDTWQHGKPVARLTPAAGPRRRVDAGPPRALTAKRS